MLASQLGLVQLTEVSDNTILFIYPASSENSKQIVEKTENLHIIRESLREYYESNLSIRFSLDKNNVITPHVSDEQSEKKNKLNELVANSSRIQNLLEKVDGKVIGIKEII